MTKAAPDAIKKRILYLREELLKHNNLYYKQNSPQISDKEYDLLFRELKDLETAYPNEITINSPSQNIGSDFTNTFSKFKHSIPVLSLDNTYNATELEDWVLKTGKDELYSIEWKIDGASLLLYYSNGLIKTCATRGTGGIGEDITTNGKMISGLPHQLNEEISIIVRCEVFMSFADFEEFNETMGGKFANPRNLAAGSLKHKSPWEVAKRPLQIFTYDGFFPQGRKGIKTHEEVLKRLKKYGLPTAPGTTFCKGSEITKEIIKFSKEKDKLPFPTDGLVIKLNSLDLRDSLGETSHSPRWARAFKFDATQKESTIEEITVATGRTGKVTPRARISPIQLAGTTVSYATLHNQDYINELGAGIGAKVLVSKRGEIIPAVEKVLEPPLQVYLIPKSCPSCNSNLQKLDDSVDLFCVNKSCPERVLNLLIFFCHKKQMSIEGLGEKQLSLFFEKGWLNNVADLFRLPSKEKEIISLDGFGEKSFKIIRDGLESAKKRDFRLLLPSLGLNEIGHKVTEILIENGYDSWDALRNLCKKKDAVEELSQIHGIGPRTTKALIEQINQPELHMLIKELESMGLQTTSTLGEKSKHQPFANQTWCVTGSFESFQPREKALDIIVRHGGRKVSSVSSKTTHLLYGPGAGSKLSKAEELGLSLFDEDKFIAFLKKEGINPFDSL